MWNISSFNNDSININLKFANPLDISPNVIYDKLIIDFSGSKKWITCVNNNTEIQLSEESVTMNTFIPK